jgi:glycosyltransferase involved in cell wall biosynthesis
VTAAELVASSPRSLRLDDDLVDPYAPQIVQLEAVAARRHDFDVIHWHLDYMHFPLARRMRVPSVTTQHGRLDIPELQPLYDEFSDMPVVSISNDQRAPLPQARWVATVHHGMPPDEYTPRFETGDYLAFLGRISPEKRVDRAIEVARRAGLPLRIAAKVDESDSEYYETEIAPLLEADHVEFVGEVGGSEKEEFVRHARALLFPIDWSEPFGLVMIEAMACGTPVIAYPFGSVPEVIRDGESGFIVETIDGMVEAVGRIDEVSRERCRRAFEERFTADRMARDYVAVYEHLTAERSGALPPEIVAAATLAAEVTSRMGADG